MKKPSENNSTEAMNLLAILALAAEMARRVNANISKVRLQLPDEVWVAPTAKSKS